MNTTHNKFLIILSLILILSGIYLYFSNGTKSEAADSSSSLVSSNGQSPVSGFSSNGETSSVDLSFVNTLTSLTTITINTSLFSDQSFNSLKDNTVKLETNVITGRVNPFAPIDSSLSSVSIVPITTNTPTQITDKTTILNGSTSSSVGVTGAYFEYGLTEALGINTPVVSQSLIGTFMQKIVNLKPKTTYFFRANAKINGVLQRGDILSFTTN